MRIISELRELEKTELWKTRFNYSIKKFMDESPYEYQWEGVASTYESLYVFLVFKDRIIKLKTGCGVEHKANNEKNLDFYDESEPINIQINKILKSINDEHAPVQVPQGLIVMFHHTDDWSDEAPIHEYMYISYKLLKQAV
jgi:hypothetical protein